MRRMLHILKWLGLSLSTLLLAATVFCWVRSWEHVEGWDFRRFEPRPDWTAPDWAGLGINRRRFAMAIHGRLWLYSEDLCPFNEFTAKTQYQREEISGKEAELNFLWLRQPSIQQWGGDTGRVWRFAGGGVLRWRSAIVPGIGRPQIEGLQVALPFWMLAVVFGLWPVGFVAWRLLRKKRHAPNLCPACGYDLRATPEAAGPLLPRCPECGREVVSAGV